MSNTEAQKFLIIKPIFILIYTSRSDVEHSRRRRSLSVSSSSPDAPFPSLDLSINLHTRTTSNKKSFIKHEWGQKKGKGNFTPAGVTRCHLCLSKRKDSRKRNQRTSFTFLLGCFFFFCCLWFFFPLSLSLSFLIRHLLSSYSPLFPSFSFCSVQSHDSVISSWG